MVHVYMNSGTKLSKYMIAAAAAGYKGWEGGLGGVQQFTIYTKVIQCAVNRGRPRCSL